MTLWLKVTALDALEVMSQCSMGPLAWSEMAADSGDWGGATGAETLAATSS